MIIYQNNIESFINECKNENIDLMIAKIKSNMKNKLGRGVAPSEERSWRTTLVKISSFFENLKYKSDQYILLEFKVPTSWKRIDVILVGSDGKRQSLLIIELKGWSGSSSSSVPKSLNIDTKYGNNVPHPSEEAKEYKKLLTNQFSDLNNEFPNLQAVSLLPNYKAIENDPLLAGQFRALIDYIKTYTKNNIEDFKKMINHLFKDGIPRKSVEFLNKLEYKPTPNFQKQLENEFKKIKLSLTQKIAYRKVVEQLEFHFKNANNKKLITISGMPGSGKTIVAFKILGYVYAQLKKTAKLQLPGPEFKDAVKSTFSNNIFNSMIGGAYAKSEQEIIIIDEAHKAYGQTNATNFYNLLFPNQNFVIALIDDGQVISKKCFDKKTIIDVAKKNRFDIIELDLKEQFRSGGDALYIDWLKNWIFKENNFQHFFVNNSFNFEMLEDKDFNSKYKRMYKNHNVRMASFWTQKWNAEFDENERPKKLIKVGSSKYIWNPNNYWMKSFKENNPNKKAPKWFLNNVVKKNFNKDKKGYEYIAYFNTIQGYEFDYIFVHIPKLFFLNKNNELDVDLSQLDMNDMGSQVWTKNYVPDVKKEEQNKMYFKNRLLVNLTRGRKGAYVFIEDNKLANWLEKKLIKK